MRLRLLPAAILLIAVVHPLFAQTPSADKGLELSATVAGALVWGEDDMGFPMTVLVDNKGHEDASAIVVRPSLFSSPDAAVKVGEILQKGCSKITADMQAHGQTLAPGATLQSRVHSNTDVEELDPNQDATPALLLCAYYKSANTGEVHNSAVLYRVVHVDPVRGPRPIDRVTGDIAAQSLKLEELGRYAR